MSASTHTHTAALDLSIVASTEFNYTPGQRGRFNDPAYDSDIDCVEVLVMDRHGNQHVAPSWLAKMIAEDIEADLIDTAEGEREAEAPSRSRRY